MNAIGRYFAFQNRVVRQSIVLSQEIQHRRVLTSSHLQNHTPSLLLRRRGSGCGEPIIFLALAAVGLARYALSESQCEEKPLNEASQDSSMFASSATDSNVATENASGDPASGVHPEDRLQTPNPLLEGVSEIIVDELVSEWIRDENINIRGLPDSLERQVYKSTIQITLNAAYSSLAAWHGEPILGHEVCLSKKSEGDIRDFLEKTRRSNKHIQEDILEQVAERLLDNKAINQPLVPDSIEKQLYVNCLKLVFRVLDLLAASLKLTICGHDVFIGLEPSTDTSIDGMRKTIDRATSSITKIDQAALREYAQQSGVQDEAPARSILTSWWHKSQDALLVQLHGSMYGLVLGILDDVLANTNLHLLSDRINIDICPPTAKSSQGDYSRSKGSLSHTKEASNTSSGGQMVAVFTMGVGVGLAVMAAVGSRPY